MTGDPRRRVPIGLCDRCMHQRIVPTSRSIFTMCEAEGMPRYPGVPVMRCRAFTPRDDPADEGGAQATPPPPAVR